MNKGRIFRIIFIPVLVGLIMTTAAYVFLSRVKPASSEKMAIANVVVAKAPIQAKTVLTKEILSSRQIPANYLAPNEITNPEEVVGKITTVPLAQGESVLKTKLASKENKSGLAYYIPAGKRALTVKVNEVIGAGGFPEPGDYVDVLGTFDRQDLGAHKTKLVAENLLVLAAARDIETKPADKKDIKAYTSLTMAVTPEEAVKITLSEEKGIVRIILRPAVQEKTVGEIEQVITGFGVTGIPSPAPKR